MEIQQQSLPQYSHHFLTQHSLFIPYISILYILEIINIYDGKGKRERKTYKKKEKKGKAQVYNTAYVVNCQ